MDGTVWWVSVLRHRKRDGEDGALPRLGRYGNRSPVRFGDFPADRKTKSGSVFLVSDKKIKKRRKILFGDAAACILYGDGNSFSIAGDSDSDRTAVGHGFRSIADQV